MFSCSCLESMERLLENLNISPEEDDELLIEGEEEEVVGSDLCLVGCFLTDQVINPNIMKGRMTDLWKPKKRVQIRDIGGGRFIFQFFHHIDLQRIMAAGPWSFGIHPLILHHLGKGEIPQQVPLKTIPFWVQITKIPMGFF